jgi:AcrR family transcriptional regulator
MTSPRSESQPNKSSPRESLSRERILTAAVRLVDEHGIEALSMRRLGAELGVEAMSIYNHIPNKAALLEALVDHVIAEVPIADIKLPWDEQIREMARSFRRLSLAHPHIVPLIAMRPFNTVTALKNVEYAFGLTLSLGLDENEALHVFRALAGFATGYTLAETGGFFAEGSGPKTDYTIDMADLSSGEYPNLMRMIPFILNCDHDKEFEFGIDLFLEGLKRKMPPR